MKGIIKVKKYLFKESFS